MGKAFISFYNGRLLYCAKLNEILIKDSLEVNLEKSKIYSSFSLLYRMIERMS